MYEWYWIAPKEGEELNIRSGYRYKTEQEAIRQGKKYLKETGRTGGEIVAIESHPVYTSYILDY